MSRKLILPLILLALAIGGWLGWRQMAGSKPAGVYKTQPVDRGDIVETISANGTLNPVVLVNVGTQVSGTIKRLNADFNSVVKKGDVLAELDPALIEAQLRQDLAALANAEANLNLARAKDKRAKELFAQKFVSQDALDQARQALDSAQAQVELARAQVARSRTNLGYTVIRSPVDGVVVARNIDVGQTVAASFQTPTLFQIAGDLKAMQIDTSVAEADIGKVQIGQVARFSVDTFMEREFEARVKQIRLNPTVQQNVVTYNVVLLVDNPEGKLMPGMTAHVSIEVGRHANVLRVPNAALRYRPQEAEEGGGKNGGKARGGGNQVYKLVDGRALAVKIKPGASDGSFTEVKGGELKPGDEVILREISAAKDKKGSAFQFRFF
ncbi:HlyD family secretion protein [Sulfuritortus calidifontis]|uniref:HlyD family secretion protein n=1 Tax=Sulfuritortus calidifontis TaxID=1914471 RepID=A0A4R3K0F7_9PROT|nr:efflux RND transporter periplasmic adaptor subunit [Sulfuritortus calidifontis]TCS73086.1 HlyD family secretion protein [Sulfuritortus calidifontis]